jgi:hypothetical protein
VRTRTILAAANLTAIFCAGVLLLAQTQDALFGTWKLNLAQSKYDPGPAPKSNTKKYEPWNGGLKATQDLVTAAGEVRHMTVAGKFDGKDNKVEGKSDMDSFAFTRLDGHTYEIVGKKGGKLMQTMRVTVAPDGKTRIVNQTGQNIEGKPVHNVLYFEKQ